MMMMKIIEPTVLSCVYATTDWSDIPIESSVNANANAKYRGDAPAQVGHVTGAAQ